MATDTTYAWEPDAQQLEASNVARLARSLGCPRYADLHRMSIEEPDRFWRAVVADLGIPLAHDWDRVLDDSRGIEWTTWFDGAQLNVADACVHRWARETPDADAAVWAPEDGARRTLSWAELSTEVRRLAEALRELGVGKGDVVATFLPMAPEAAIAAHACAHVGAIQAPIFSGFARPGGPDRAPQVRARGHPTAPAKSTRSVSPPEPDAPLHSFD